MTMRFAWVRINIIRMNIYRFIGNARYFSKPLRIHPVHRIIFNICIKVQAPSKANGISRDIPSSTRIIKPVPAIMKPALLIVILARETKVIGYPIRYFITCASP